MTEEQITALVSKIDGFEASGNFMRIYFKDPKDVDGLKKSFEDLGITDIINAKTIGATGYHIDKYMLEVNWIYSPQKKIIDDLEFRHKRMKAWSVLRGWGGAQMTEAEKKFFANQDAEIDAKIAAYKLQQSKDM